MNVWKSNFTMTRAVLLSVAWLVGRSVGLLVCLSFFSLRRREVTLPCPYRSTLGWNCLSGIGRPITIDCKHPEWNQSLCIPNMKVLPCYHDRIYENGWFYALCLGGRYQPSPLAAPCSNTQKNKVSLLGLYQASFGRGLNGPWSLIQDNSLISTAETQSSLFQLMRKAFHNDFWRYLKGLRPIKFTYAFYCLWRRLS